MHSLVAKFCHFEGAGIALLSQEKRELLVPLTGGTYAIPECLCLLWDTVQNKTMKVFENVRRKIQFDPATDNISEVGDLDNCLFACLLGPENQVVGVLQLANKTTGNITPGDIQIAGQLSVLIGNIAAVLVGC